MTKLCTDIKSLGKPSLEELFQYPRTSLFNISSGWKQIGQGIPINVPPYRPPGPHDFQ